jgi:hypothetical protein
METAPRSILDIGGPRPQPTPRLAPLPTSAIPLVVGRRICRDYNMRIHAPIAVPAVDRYRRRGWFVRIGEAETGTFYYMRGDGRVQASGSGYPTPASQVVVCE